MVKCDICGKVCKTTRGLSIHKSYHTESQPVSEINEIDNLIPNSLDQAINVLQEQRKKRMLTALEENNLLTIKLENKRMQDELTGVKPQPSQPEQKSELDTFQKFVDMQEKMASGLSAREENLKNKIREEIADQVGGEDSSMETRLAFEALGLLKAKMAAGQLPASQTTLPGDNIPIVTEAPMPQPPVKKNMENPVSVRAIFEEKIRSGKLSFAQAKKQFRAKYPGVDISDAMLKKEYDRIKNDKRTNN